jgi:hypothetical protein
MCYHFVNKKCKIFVLFVFILVEQKYCVAELVAPLPMVVKVSGSNLDECFIRAPNKESF